MSKNELSLDGRIPNPKLNKLLTTNELAQVLHVSPTTVYRLTSTRRIPFYRIAGSIRFDVDDVRSMLRSCYREDRPTDFYGSS